jgi:hypothetical protein
MECPLVQPRSTHKERVRLKPQESGEVVWGERLDPARLLILSVPLRITPQVLWHRFERWAENGTRVVNGVRVPVFDELRIWRTSAYSTLRVKLRVPNEESERQLIRVCGASEIGVEDWSILRIICTVCSSGTPGPHDCQAMESEDGTRTFGIAAKNHEDAVRTPREWAATRDGAYWRKAGLLFFQYFPCIDSRVFALFLTIPLAQTCSGPE